MLKHTHKKSIIILYVLLCFACDPPASYKFVVSNESDSVIVINYRVTDYDLSGVPTGQKDTTAALQSGDKLLMKEEFRVGKVSDYYEDSLWSLGKVNFGLRNAMPLNKKLINRNNWLFYKSMNNNTGVYELKIRNKDITEEN